MNEASRKTGIDILEDVSWGSHFCLFYQTEAEVLEVMLPYFKAGLENNEFCLWITPPSLRQEEALGAMQKAVRNFSQYLAEGQMEVLPHKEWYLKGGQFDSNRIVKGWVAKLNEALDRGHKGLRAASGYARGKNEWGQVIGYEKEMNGFISVHPMIAMCAYPTKELAASEVIDLAASHRFILTKRETWQLIENAGLKQVDEALRKEEERHRLLLDSLPVLISYVDSGQRYRFVNKAYEDWFGLPYGEIYGRHIREVVGESGYQAIQGYIETVLPGRQVEYETWIPYKRVGVRYVSVVYVPDFDEMGKVRGFFALITDRTEKRRSEELLAKYRDHLEELVEERTSGLKIANERLQQEIIEHKRTEEALRENEQRLNRSEGIAHLGTWELDLVNNRLTWSNEVYRIFGLQPQEFGATYEAFLKAVHPDDRAAVDAAYSDSVREGRDTYEIEHRVVRKSTGEIRTVLERCEHIRDASGRVIRSIGMVHDITERKRAEEALRESEGRYHLVVEHANQGIGIIQNGVVKFSNPNVSEITGYSAEELGSRPFLEFVHAEDKAIVARNYSRRLEGEASPQTYEFRILDREGNIKWLELYAALITWENKPASLGIFSEITKRKETEERIRIYQDQLRSLASELSLIEERERRRIASDLHDHVGHRLAISKIKLGELGERISSSLVKPLDDIRKLIEETIKYTRTLTSDLSPPILYEFGFEPAVEWLAEEVRKKHNLRVDFEDDEQPKPMEKQMRFLLFKAVEELLINIVKHAQANKAKVAIRRENSQIRVTVEDDGVGFHFSETNPFGRSGGFGLFSVRERLRHLGGSLQVRSGLGRGTCITLVAPLTPEKKPEVYH